MYSRFESTLIVHTFHLHGHWPIRLVLPIQLAISAYIYIEIFTSSQYFLCTLKCQIVLTHTHKHTVSVQSLHPQYEFTWPENHSRSKVQSRTQANRTQLRRTCRPSGACFFTVVFFFTDNNKNYTRKLWKMQLNLLSTRKCVPNVDFAFWAAAATTAKGFVYLDSSGRISRFFINFSTK